VATEAARLIASNQTARDFLFACRSVLVMLLKMR
jgi:hypothetical protein